MRIEHDLIYEASCRQLSLDEYNALLIILSNTPKNSLVDSISPIDLVKILSFMDFEDEHFSDIAERIAKLIFPLFPIDFVQQSSDLLVTIFCNENYQLTLLIFNELTNVVQLFKNQGDVIIFTDEVIMRIVDMIFSQYLELSSTAQRLLISYCEQSPDICIQIFQKIMKPKFKDLLPNSVNIFRYIDVSIDIVLKSKHSELFDLAVNDDMITVIKEIINGEDLLSHMNVLDVIKKLTSDPSGYHLVNDRKILDNLYKRLPDISESPFNTILLPGYLSLFGQLYRTYLQDTISRYGDFLVILMENFENDNFAIKMQALEIFANFASVPQCKLWLAKEYGYGASIVTRAISALTELLTVSDPERQGRASNALAHILSAPRGQDSYGDVVVVNEQWCRASNSAVALMAYIARAVVVPIEEVKVAALTLAVALSTQAWAQRLMCGHDHFIDYILVRADQWKSCIDLKYDVIGNLVWGLDQCTGVAVQPRLCSDSVASRLRQYQGEGKYYAVFQHDMMVDTDV